MRLWLRYLREKKTVLLLYLLTAALFLAVGSLYHIENLGKLSYAALLTLVPWAGAGLWSGNRYVRRSRRLEELSRQFQQSGELFLEEAEERLIQEAEGCVEAAQNLQEAELALLALIRHRQSQERRGREEQAAEQNDYYVMWTHQIKTPISAMKLLLEESGLPDRSSFLMREELFKIEQYVEMALTFQRLGSISSDLVLQEYDLYALLRDVVRKYSLLFINKSLSLNLPEESHVVLTDDIVVLTDEKWFSFCMGQLLSNGIKYTQRGGISIRTESQEEQIMLTLEDTGIGIRAEDLPRIFERGFTGYNGRLDKKSTGIGLYLCRQVCSHLNITIQVESQEGRGTRVLLGIPRPGGPVRD